MQRGNSWHNARLRFKCVAPLPRINRDMSETSRTGYLVGFSSTQNPCHATSGPVEHFHNNLRGSFHQNSSAMPSVTSQNLLPRMSTVPKLPKYKDKRETQERIMNHEDHEGRNRLTEVSSAAMNTSNHSRRIQPPDPKKRKLRT